jgi:16S rRNA (guanine966-N2)-methyltransferase
MRIIAGAYKGRRLVSPKNDLVRPTSDRVREFIFSIIGEDIQGSAVLDLFAGTSALGLEAKSRGAADVVFVDAARQSLDIVRKNCELVGLQAGIIKGDAAKVLGSGQLSGSFDYIFCDPPYLYAEFELILAKIREFKRLNAGGQVVYESSSRSDAPHVAGFIIVKQKKMGDTQVTFYLLE